ncbi:hypothetical protein ABFS83_11G120500 [Erythranthe nasuta]
MSTSHILSIFILALISLSPIGQAKRDTPSEQKQAPFEFIKTLQGCHKGNKTKEIHNLKNYLHQFGYLQYPNRTHANYNDDFDETLESAVKTYQRNYHINPTGTLDAITVSTMTTTRCGVADIINGDNTMQKPGTKKHESGSSGHIHTVSHYSFFPGNLRWPPSRTHLTFGFSPNTPAGAVAPIVRAFQRWDAATHFTFSQAPSGRSADMVIGFHRRNHGDGAPFDGPGGTLAHAFAPTNGRFHYDADERWSIGPVPNAFDLETVALHEIGHLLGLGHSSVEAAIMYPRLSSGRTKGLNADDIQGIRALYNV